MGKNNLAELYIEKGHIHRNGKLILEDVNLMVRRGEIVYVIGDPGSGKTTLLQALYGAVPLTTGTGVSSGFNLETLDWKRQPYLARNLGIVNQDPQFQQSLSVYSHLRMMLTMTGWKEPKLMGEKIHQVLEQVGLAMHKDKLPYQLSDGELQRVDIARSLLNSPKGLIADEPTANLDSETSREIMSLLTTICRDYGSYLVMSTYDYLLIHRFPGRILKIEGEQLREIGLDELCK